MRELTDHKVNVMNESITITAYEPGSGGADTVYVVSGPNELTTLKFQNGPIADGINCNVSNEVLLVILEDRLLGFSKGQFDCEETKIALYHVNAARDALLTRSRERCNRGVEGTHQV